MGGATLSVGGTRVYVGGNLGDDPESGCEIWSIDADTSQYTGPVIETDYCPPMSNDADTVAALVRDVLAVRVDDDGIAFEPDRLRAHVIREGDPYAGVRLTIPARVARARHPLRVDVNVGDPVTPALVEVWYPALLGEPFPLIGYPLESVLAEKIVTMVDRGDTTTRERDFADAFLLTGRHVVDAARLAAAIQATAACRQSDLRPLRVVLVTLAAARQLDWERFIHRSGLVDSVPGDYAQTIASVAGFADPILTGEVSSGEWDPVAREWRT